MNVYDKAAAVIEERGWAKGAYNTKYGVCATYALMLAVNPEIDEDAWVDEVQLAEYSASCRFMEKLLLDKDLINARTPMSGFEREDKPYTLVGWNDMVAKDADDVIHLLKEASEAWDLEHPE